MKGKKPIRTILKKSLAGTLSLSLVCPTALADRTDDFIRSTQAAKEKYWEQIRQIIELEKNSYAPTFAKDGLVTSLFVTNSYISQVVGAISLQAEQLDKTAGIINEKVDSSSRYTGTSASLEGLSSLVALEKQLNQALMEGRSLAAQSKDHLAIVTTLLQSYDAFCSRAVPELELEMMEPSPYNFIIHPRYLRTASARFWSEDPVARGYSVAAGVITIAAAIAVYAEIQGLSYTAAASTLASQVTLETAGGEVLLGTTSAEPFFIIAVAVALASTVGKAKADAENARRKKEAEDAFRSLMDAISQAQDYYREKRISTETFRAMSMASCTNMASAIDPDTQKPGILFAQINSWQMLLQQLKAQIQSNERMAEQFDKVQSSFKELRTRYEIFLVQTYGRQLVEDHLKKVRSQLKIAEAWEYYNTSIKPRGDDLFHFYLANRTDCYALLQRQLSFAQELTTHYTLIEGTYKDELNASHSFFQDVRSLGKGIATRFEDRVKRCGKGDGDVPPEILF